MLQKRVANGQTDENEFYVSFVQYFEHIFPCAAWNIPDLIICDDLEVKSGKITPKYLVFTESLGSVADPHPDPTYVSLNNIRLKFIYQNC